jgi:hypothetical protein
MCLIELEFVNRLIVENCSEEQKQRAWQNPIVTEQLGGRRYNTGGL